MAINLAPVFQTVGDYGNSLSRGYLNALQLRMQQLRDQLGLKRETTEEETREEELRRLKKQPSTEEETLGAKVSALRSVFKQAGYGDISEEDVRKFLGLPMGAKSQEAIKADIEEGLGKMDPKVRGMVEPAIRAYMQSGQYDKALQAYSTVAERISSRAPQKPTQTKTYDPSGNLRYAWTDTDTGEIVSWGGLVPASDLHEKYTDEAGNVHDVTLERFRKVDPGTIRMSDKAEKQWQSIGQATTVPHPSKLTSSGGTKSGGGDRVIGRTTPKYSAALKPLMTDAGVKYKIWTDALKNSQFKTPRTDLAIIFAAVRTQVQGAGRMTNTELDRELKAGSYGDQLRRRYDMALHGTLPDDQREDLLRVIRNAWLASAQTARAQWQMENSGQPLPPYMKGEDINTEGDTNKTGAPPPGAKIIPLDQFLNPEKKPSG